MMAETFVYIENLRLYAYHGVLPQERIVGNGYVINVRVGYPWYAATASDDVRDTLNYAELADIIEKEMAIQSALLEHVAGRIEKAIVTAFPHVTSLHLDIRKIAPPIAQQTNGCGVIIEKKYES